MSPRPPLPHRDIEKRATPACGYEAGKPQHQVVRDGVQLCHDGRDCPYQRIDDDERRLCTYKTDESRRRYMNASTTNATSDNSASQGNRG